MTRTISATSTTTVSGASEQEISDQLSSITNRVSVDELLKRGKKTVKTVDERQLKAWINEALRMVMSTSSAIDEETHQKLLDDTRAELKRVMTEHQKEAKQREAFQKAASELQAQLADLHKRSNTAGSDAEKIRALTQERDLLASRMQKYEDEVTSTSTELSNLERILDETRRLFERAESDRQKLQKAMSGALMANGELIEEALAIDRDWCGSRHSAEHEIDAEANESEEAEMDAFAESAPARAALSDLRAQLDELHAALATAVPGFKDDGAMRGDLARIQALRDRDLPVKPAKAAAASAPAVDLKPKLLAAEAASAAATAEAAAAKARLEAAERKAAAEAGAAQARIDAAATETSAAKARAAAAEAEATRLRGELERARLEAAAALAKAAAAAAAQVRAEPVAKAAAPRPLRPAPAVRRDGRGHVIVGGTFDAKDSTAESGAPAASYAAHGWFWEKENSAHVAFTDTTGMVWELMDLGQGWRSAPIGTQALAPAAAGAPQGYAPEDHEHVIYRGADNHVHELCFHGKTWIHHDLTVLAKAPPAAADPRGGYIAGRHVVAYRGADGNLHSLVLGRDWRHRNLGPIAPGEVLVTADGVVVTAASGERTVLAV